MLYAEVRSGRLTTDHIFYRLILNALKFARQIGNPREQFQHDNVLRSFCESIYRNGHLNALKFARQIGNPREQFQHDNVLRSYCESIYRNGHMKMFNLLTGKRMLNKVQGLCSHFQLGRLQYSPTNTTEEYWIHI